MNKSDSPSKTTYILQILRTTGRKLGQHIVIVIFHRSKARPNYHNISWKQLEAIELHMRDGKYIGKCSNNQEHIESTLIL